MPIPGSYTTSGFDNMVLRSHRLPPEPGNKTSVPIMLCAARDMESGGTLRGKPADDDGSLLGIISRST